jgi:aspartate kinase
MSPRPLTIQKYGGTSVGSPERVRAVADRVVEARRAGSDLVVVVSAMGDTTDELLSLAREVTEGERAALDHPREMDMLLTAGERISMALLAMAIRARGEGAVSLTGSQAAIITDEVHTAARITEVRADRVRAGLSDGKVVIVAGFQGVSRTREVTTLGRGGSDTTAVALAAALDADRCEIYTDVPGVYTADPRRVSGARVIPEISYTEMLELATGGAQVMHARAIEIASRFDVDVWVGSSFAEGPEPGGTLITRTPRRMEQLVLTGISAQRGHAKLVIRGLRSGMRSVTAVLVALADAGVSVDMIAEAQEVDGAMQLQATVAEAQVADAKRVVEGVLRDLGGGEVEVQAGLSRVALVGSGMHQQPGVYARAFRTLLDGGIDVSAVSTSGISITLWVPADRQDDAVNALHGAFSLELAGAGGEGSAT